MAASKLAIDGYEVSILGFYLIRLFSSRNVWKTTILQYGQGEYTYLGRLLVVLGDVCVLVQAEHVGRRDGGQRAHVRRHRAALHAGRHAVQPRRRERIAGGRALGSDNIVSRHSVAQYLRLRVLGGESKRREAQISSRLVVN